MRGKDTERRVRERTQRGGCEGEGHRGGCEGEGHREEGVRGKDTERRV